MPFGIFVAPEEIQRRIDDALLVGLNSVYAVHDNIIGGKGDYEVETEKDHDRNVKKLLEQCREKKIKLNKEKVEFKKPYC